MNDKQLRGLPVITAEDGERLGGVERAYLDPTTKRIVGFAYTAGGGFLQTEYSPMVDAEDIATLNETALTVTDADAVRGAETTARYVDLIDLHELTGRAVLTDDGINLGQIAASTFDEQTFELTGFDVSSGSLFGKHSNVPANRIVSLGGEVVVVRGEGVDNQTGDPDAATASSSTPAAEREPFQEEWFEIPLRRQELTVRKEIRLAEEVVLSKEAFERSEQVGDTVRRERVQLTEREIETRSANTISSASDADVP